MNVSTRKSSHDSQELLQNVQRRLVQCGIKMKFSRILFLPQHFGYFSRLASPIFQYLLERRESLVDSG